MKKNIGLVLITIITTVLISGCGDFTTSTDKNTEYTYLEESPSCKGNTHPYGDYQVDSQCQAACGYLEAGNTQGVEATCNILKGWEEHMENMYATDCPACGGTTSPSSGGGNTGTGTATVTITDNCDDGLPIDYKFYDRANSRVWPSSSTHYTTGEYGYESIRRLSCTIGAKICYGGKSGDTYWGVNLDGKSGCESCCITCQEDAKLSKVLSCN